MNDFTLALVLAFSIGAGAILLVTVFKAVYVSLGRTGCAWVGYLMSIAAMLGVIWAVWRGMAWGTP